MSIIVFIKLKIFLKKKIDHFISKLINFFVLFIS